jgi:hypothetical protein
MASDDLSDEHRALLEFERDWPIGRAGKDEAIRTQFGLTPARYYQVLGFVIETEPALKYDPLLVTSLLRARDHRLRARRQRITPPNGS